MATVDVQTPVEPPAAEPAPALPDYLTDPDATLKDAHAKWRYGRAPDYSKTRQVFTETKSMSHEAGSLPELVQNLVKNWEVEASFKPNLSDWRTVDHENYSFAINGSEPQGAEHMLKLGTYNAIIAPNEYYSPEYSDFASSHKTFKRMMPTFAWEVLEVYSGPPTVSFRWRHWGTFKNDYIGFNNKGEKVTAKAHGRAIDIQGVTVATVNDKVQLQAVRTWFDPMDMFRQIAPDGVVQKDAVDKKLSPDAALDSDCKVEIDQTPRPVETPTSTAALPDRTRSSDSSTSQKADEAEKLVEAVACPFAGSHPKEAVAPFPPTTVEQNVDGTTEDGAWSKIEHPNLPLSPSTMETLASGVQTGIESCPFAERAPNGSV
ncbi:hypothetical protein BDV95DRAFT_605581 [Massariosphaeria phaeospora]|uniref:Pathogen-related protein n=1 Tax=Massariosphaeria phaeospora TaxID=100035 RepID=A0A7C8MGY0_9PLEO|nr:hypothetical protein BDV95DRAFT_605581 [Massariosphaeria phaeospora]